MSDLIDSVDFRQLKRDQTITENVSKEEQKNSLQHNQRNNLLNNAQKKKEIFKDSFWMPLVLTSPIGVDKFEGAF